MQLLLVHVMQAIGNMLLKTDSASQLAYVRCDAFEVLEGETMLSLRERPLTKGSMRLLTGLLKNNRDVQELDLGATSMYIEWATALITESLIFNPAVTALHLPFNSSIDESGKAALLAAVEQHHLKIVLHF